MRSLTTPDSGPQIPVSTKVLVETTVANALAGFRKESVTIEARVAQLIKAERKEREGQFGGLRNEFRNQQQVVRSEVAEISAALRKLPSGVSEEREAQKLVTRCTDTSEKILEMITDLGIITELAAVREKAISATAASEQLRKEIAMKAISATAESEQLRKEIAIMKQTAEEGNQKTAACIDDYVTLKKELKDMQKTMFEWQAFRVKQEANMAKVLKLFEDHRDDFECIKKFDTDIKAVIDQLLKVTETQAKTNVDLAKAKKKTSECIDECQDIRKDANEIKKTFEEYERDCDELANYLPESKRSGGMSLFDRMKIMFHKEHKLQPLVHHREDLKIMLEKTFAALEGELRSGLQKEKEDHLLSTISLDHKLDDYLVVEKRQAERVHVLEDTMQEYRTKVDVLTEAVPDKAAISKQLMENVVDRDIKLQQLVEKLTRHGEELAQQKQTSDTLQEDFTRRSDSLQQEFTSRSDALKQELTQRGAGLQEELTKRSDALHETSRKFTAETFHGLRKAQLKDVQSYVKQQLEELKQEINGREREVAK